mmetsp:Transcript_21157/g.47658  ORF Transcript_21157/g.47658 Transcript_21157/m.47658 type:complete len:264 (-) Transcript_21157:691-1482(-)
MVQGQLRVHQTRDADDFVHLGLQLNVLPVLVLRSLRHHLQRVRQPHHLLAQLVQLRVTLCVLFLQAADAGHPLSLRHLIIREGLGDASLLQRSELLLCSPKRFPGPVQRGSQLIDLLPLLHGLCFAGIELRFQVVDTLHVGVVSLKIGLLRSSMHLSPNCHALPDVSRLNPRFPLVAHGRVQPLHLLIQTRVLSLHKFEFYVQLPTIIFANKEPTFKVSAYRFHVISQRLVLLCEILVHPLEDLNLVRESPLRDFTFSYLFSV